MAEKVKITINGHEYEAENDQTILEVARANGIYIPTLCYLKNVNEIGACRMCVVEIEGHSHLFPSCNTKVWEGMAVRTDSEKVKLSRQFVLQLMLAWVTEHLITTQESLLHIRKMSSSTELSHTFMHRWLQVRTLSVSVKLRTAG